MYIRDKHLPVQRRVTHEVKPYALAAHSASLLQAVRPEIERKTNLHFGLLRD